MMKRRSMLVLGGGIALAGCAARRPATPAARVVVIGGGFGGATAAHYLRRWAPELEVTLVERQAQFVSCPLSNLVITGQRELASVTLGYDGLAAAGVKVVHAHVEAIDPARRRVRLAGGEDIPYDRLLLSPGIDFIWDQVAGLESAVASGRVVHAWKAGAQTLALRQQLRDMRDGGVVALTIPRAPYRCPPGPYERACLIAAYLRVAKPRSKLLVLDANPEIQSKKALFERAFAQHHTGVLEYHPDAELKEVDGLTARLEFEDVKADVLNVIPPQRAADIARRSGLVNINDRWAGVQWRTMESTAASGIHVLGDAVFPAAVMPKSGHMANQHAKLAAAAVVQLLRGEEPNPTPVLMNTCYSFVTPDEAAHVASVHQYDAAEQTFKPVPGAGGVSPAASRTEGRFALDWAQNIWADTLALPAGGKT